MIAMLGSQAGAESTVPSPDGKFQVCLPASELTNIAGKVDFPGLMRWTSEATPRGGAEKRLLSVKATGPIENRPWRIWTGWPASKTTVVAKPELACAWLEGAGVILLTKNSDFPTSPFGRSYPDNDGWTIDPFVKQNNDFNTQPYYQCLMLAELIKLKGGKPKSCDLYDFQGQDKRLKSKGYYPRVILRSRTDGTFLTMYLNSKSEIIVTHTGVDGISYFFETGTFELSERILAALSNLEAK